MKRKAFITGITGQDGSYLAELLLERDYEVYGMVRRASTFNRARIDHLFGEIELVYGDLGDGSSLNQLLRTIRPDEVYNLGAQSHVRVSFDVPEYTADVVALGTLRLLDAIREGDLRCRFYQASSSEMFGKVDGVAAERGDAVSSAQPLRRRARCSDTGSHGITGRRTGCTP